MVLDACYARLLWKDYPVHTCDILRINEKNEVRPPSQVHHVHPRSKYQHWICASCLKQIRSERPRTKIQIDQYAINCTIKKDIGKELLSRPDQAFPAGAMSDQSDVSW